MTDPTPAQPPERITDWATWSAEMHARLHPTPGDVEQVRAHFNAAGTFARYDHAEMRVVFDALDALRSRLALTEAERETVSELEHWIAADVTVLIEPLMPKLYALVDRLTRDGGGR